MWLILNVITKRNERLIVCLTTFTPSGCKGYWVLLILGRKGGVAIVARARDPRTPTDLWPGLESRTRLRVWVGFVVGLTLALAPRLFPSSGQLGFLPSQKPKLQLLIQSRCKNMPF